MIWQCYCSVAGSLITDRYRYIASPIIDDAVTDREHAVRMMWVRGGNSSGRKGVQHHTLILIDLHKCKVILHNLAPSKPI